MKLLLKLLLIITSVLLISCDTENKSVIADKLKDISDNQKLLLRKIEKMGKSIFGSGRAGRPAGPGRPLQNVSEKH